MNKNRSGCRRIRPVSTTTATAEIVLGALSAPAVMKHIRFCGCAACKPKPVKPVKKEGLS